MDPNDLRNCVERKIKKLIEPEGGNAARLSNKAEEARMRNVLGPMEAAKQ